MHIHSRDNFPSHGDDVRASFGVGISVCSVADTGQCQSQPTISLAVRCGKPAQLRHIFVIHLIRDKVTK